MKHRQLKTECICTVTINNKLVICNELRAIKKLNEKNLEINEKNFESCLDTAEFGDVDLLIRTSVS